MTEERKYTLEEIENSVGYLLNSVHQYGHYADRRDEDELSDEGLDTVIAHREFIPSELATMVERLYTRFQERLCDELISRMKEKGIDTTHLE